MKIGDTVHFVLATAIHDSTNLSLDEGNVVSFDQGTVCVWDGQNMHFVAPYQLFSSRDEAGEYLHSHWQNYVTSPELSKRFVTI